MRYFPFTCVTIFSISVYLIIMSDLNISIWFQPTLVCAKRMYVAMNREHFVGHPTTSLLRSFSINRMVLPLTGESRLQLSLQSCFAKCKKMLMFFPNPNEEHGILVIILLTIHARPWFEQDILHNRITVTCSRTLLLSLSVEWTWLLTSLLFSVSSHYSWCSSGGLMEYSCTKC